MSSLAELAMRHNFDVRGSDPADSPTLKYLRSLGIKLFENHAPSNVEGCGAVIYSSAISGHHPEILRARELGLKVVHRSEFLQSIAENFQSIAITGTHGKTTTSALISHMLIKCGLDPTCLVGGIVRDWGSTFRFGSSKLLVFEADESDGSFLNYRPHISVVTNIDVDHLDHYGNLDGLVSAVQKYIGQTDSEGCNVICWDDQVLKSLNPGEIERIAYGIKLGSDVRAIEIHSQNGRQKFKALIGKKLVSCDLPMIGRHNILNSLAALSVASSLEIDLEKAAEALQSFAGVGRRFERVASFENGELIDDYAHNPGKIEAVLTAIRAEWPNHKIVCVFQPHRFSRIRTSFAETCKSLEVADQVLLLPVYSAGEPVDQEFEFDVMVAKFESATRTEIIGSKTHQSAVEKCASFLKSNRMVVIVTVGAGDVWKVAQSLKVNLSTDEG